MDACWGRQKQSDRALAPEAFTGWGKGQRPGNGKGHSKKSGRTTQVAHPRWEMEDGYWIWQRGQERIPMSEALEIPLHVQTGGNRMAPLTDVTARAKTRGWGWEVQSMFGKQQEPGMTEAEEAGPEGPWPSDPGVQTWSHAASSPGYPWYPGPPHPWLSILSESCIPQSSLHLQYTIQGALGTKLIISWAPWHLQSCWTAPWLYLLGLSTSITSLLSPMWVLPACCLPLSTFP